MAILLIEQYIAELVGTFCDSSVLLLDFTIQIALKHKLDLAFQLMGANLLMSSNQAFVYFISLCSPSIRLPLQNQSLWL